jgi:hypothetical protein
MIAPTGDLRRSILHARFLKAEIIERNRCRPLAEQVGVAIGRGSDFYGSPVNSAALVIRHTTFLIEGMTFRIA